MVNCTCGKTVGFDIEDGCFRCWGCGKLHPDPSQKLQDEFADAVAEYTKRLTRSKGCNGGTDQNEKR